MGFFDFVAEAGASLFKGDEPKEDITKPIAVQIKEAGVNTDDLKVKFRGDTVTLSGYVPTQEDKEKAVLVAGNIRGVAAVQDNSIVGQPPADDAEKTQQMEQAIEQSSTTQASFRTYTVKSGDTLSKIAKELYGKASLYNKIFKANTPMLKDPDHIYPGQVLKIPD